MLNQTHPYDLGNSDTVRIPMRTHGIVTVYEIGKSGGEDTI